MRENRPAGFVEFPIDPSPFDPRIPLCMGLFRCFPGAPPTPYLYSERPMISFMISDVPPAMRDMRASAQARAMGYSHM